MNERNFFNDPTIAVTRNLLIINFLIALAATISQKVHPSMDWYSYLSLHFWKSSAFHPAQLFTYMFLHSLNWSHVLFNMFSLFMFGRLLEMTMGPKKFLTYYAFCGIGAAIIQEIFWTIELWPDLEQINEITNKIAAYAASTDMFSNPFYINTGSRMIEIHTMGDWDDYADKLLSSHITVGASGAVFGILLAFGMLFPNLSMFIMFIPVPVKAKYVVIGYALLEFFFGITRTMSGIAHFAHLGGMLFGLLLILYWRKKGEINSGSDFF
ncbi:MAG: rhomboid family intramembrane serine protease [Paludibacteraceae bacterium]|nr:rhomboid family intramembrane serine protease [Paludibacteraceae bacterium]